VLSNDYLAQTKALFTTTTYSFDSHSRSKAFSLLDIKTGKVSIALNDTSASEVVWLGDSIAYLKGSTDVAGGTDLWVSSSDKYGNTRYFVVHSYNNQYL